MKISGTRKSRLSVWRLLSAIDGVFLPRRRNFQMKKVIIIGGGFAGLSAATELSSAGFRVTLIEQRRFLRGRGCSFFDKNTGLELDNGQHILMGCYENTFRFL